jgi:hypothetical protein
VHAVGSRALAGETARVSPRTLAGGVAVLALILATLALLYARGGAHALRTRHADPRAGILSLLLARDADILARNDADLYASWRLARVNASTALILSIVAGLLSLPA